MIFNPASSNVAWDPKIMAAQSQLDALSKPEDMNFFGKGFIGGHESQGSWWTSALTGQILSKFADDDSEKDWFIQRNSIQLVGEEIDRELDAYNSVADARGLTKQEYDHVSDLIGRRDMIKRDLGLVFDKLDGDMDAPLDIEGKSFNERWGFAQEDEQGMMEILSILRDNPAYTAGILTAELIKDSPMLLLGWGIGHGAKSLSFSAMVSKVANKLQGIQPIALKGLKIPLRGAAQLGTGVGAGAGAGAGYEAAYSQLEQGTVKGADTWMGAQFGAAFGILGGIGLRYKGRQLTRDKEFAKEFTTPDKVEPRNAFYGATAKIGPLGPPLGILGGFSLGVQGSLRGATKSAAQKVLSKATGSASSASKETLKNVDVVRKATDVRDEDRITSQAQESSILNDIQHSIETIEGKAGDKNALTTTSDIDGRINTIVNKKALEFEHKLLMRELDTNIEKNTLFRGVDPSRFSQRKEGTIRNIDAYKFMRIAEAKAKEVERVKSRFEGEQLTDRELNDRAFATALAELSKLDDDFLKPKVTETAPRLTPEEAEFENIRRQNVAQTPEAAEPLPPSEPGVMEGVGGAIKANPKTAMAAGGLVGYGLAETDENKFFGTVLGVAALGLGPKVVNVKSLKAAAMKAKISISQSIEGFASNSKILEFQMQVVLKEVKESFDEVKQPGSGMLLINALENPKGLNKGGATNWDLLSDAQKDVAKKVRAILDIIGTEAVASGVIKAKSDVTQLKFHKFSKDKQGAFLQNYFPHIFDKDIDEDTLQELVAIYLKESKSGIQRTMMETLEVIDNKYSDKNVITSPVRALELYTQAMAKTIYGKNLINSLFKLNLDMTGRNLPALMSNEVFKSLRKTDKKHGGLTEQEGLKYVGFDHPSLQGYVAHTDVKNLIDDQFATLRRGGLSDVAEGILKLNNGLKRLFVFGSLFHAQALMMSASYALGPSGIGKGFRGGKVSIKDADGKVIGTREASWSDLKIGSGEFNELAEEAIRKGLQIIAIKKQELVNPGFKAMEEALERLGPMGALASKAFKNVDYLTWEYFHDRFKLAAYLQKKKRLVEKDGHTDEVAGKLAAEFANDAFGSLDWNSFATKLYTYAANNPNNLRGKTADALASVLPVNKRRWLNLGLFAPDWTISNIRIVGKTFTTAKSYTEGFLKSFHRGDNAAWRSKEGKELASSFKMYAAYSARAGVMTSGMWYAMTEAFSDEKPTMENLQEFWFGETSGKLQLGGGESMVISKQIAEPIHWVQHPAHTLMNKGSVVPKTIIEGMFNKQWFSMKKGFPMGPAIVEPDGTYHYPKWILGKAVPIVTKPMFDTKLNWGERFQRVFSGFFGFPQYGEPGKYD